MLRRGQREGECDLTTMSEMSKWTPVMGPVHRFYKHQFTKYHFTVASNLLVSEKVFLHVVWEAVGKVAYPSAINSTASKMKQWGWSFYRRVVGTFCLSLFSAPSTSDKPSHYPQSILIDWVLRTQSVTWSFPLSNTKAPEMWIPQAPKAVETMSSKSGLEDVAEQYDLNFVFDTLPHPQIKKSHPPTEQAEACLTSKEQTTIKTLGTTTAANCRAEQSSLPLKSIIQMSLFPWLDCERGAGPQRYSVSSVYASGWAS